MSKILYGTTIVDEYKKEIKKEIDENEYKPVLAIIVAKGYSDASSIYVRNKHKIAEEVGIRVREFNISYENVNKDLFRDSLFTLIDELNKDESVDGIIVQLPCPHISDNEIADLIATEKDVDGFCAKNMGGVVRNSAFIEPCTPAGAMLLLDFYNIKIEGKICCVIGRSNILGKPLANMLINRGGTVISCNSKTENIKQFTSLSDIVLLATGNAKMFNKEYFKEGAIVIDFGMNRDENNRLCGDLDIESTKDILSAYTPTPKGTGVLTTLVLMTNTLKAHKNKYK